MLYFAEQYAGPLADVSYPFMALQNRLLFGEDADARAVEAINASGKPILVVHGAGDEVIPEKLSILSRREEITNEAAVFCTVTETGRDGHSTAWLTADAAEYAEACAEELERLEQQSEEEAGNFCLAADRERMHRLDEDFMAMVLDFCTAAAAGDR